ncbi:Exopolyphosphatase [Saliniradius amylolyticus]|uniref:Guanosine-5'-triphosphate,3'-diphosphate pyrophosphatase n=1 Tax=Saliniradius amylolyticus TaxID=2183582 RepID=A0A2S2E6J0_9ALTE|nr:guanosine-5'-triphosphate,3'-diphosphate pyrophosphatase [Saliniradius amylolyticus]AWL13261.1 Exopolyphosphatase [Saliniradius amylolyticus]
MSTDSLITDIRPEQYYAAVDLGSNSFHLLIVRVSHGHVHIVGKVKQKVRLAAGLNDNNELDELAMERGWKCLETFAERLKDIPQQHIQVVATATLRLATNAEVFVRKANEILGHKIRVISGEEEARQIYLGVAYTSANQGRTLVIDIGGASTEVILGQEQTPEQLVSLELGCVTYLSRYFPEGVLTRANFDAAMKAAKMVIEPVAERFTQSQWQQCLGASGTPQAVTEILVSQGINDAIRLHHLHEFIDKAIDCGSLEQLTIDGLAESRRPVFPSGLAILTALFEVLGIEQMQIAGGALREGLIYGMLENIQHDNVREQTLGNLMRQFHIDTHQAMRVAQTAENLWQQLGQNGCEVGALGTDVSELLWAASCLHEIGLHIGYKHSHRHGGYILNHVPMPGFNKLQQECIRDLVANHRQEIDLGLFDNYQQQTADKLKLMCRMLRLAHVLSVRRKDDLLPEIKITLDGQKLELRFPPQWLKEHPLLDAELANECWLQHKAGWSLTVH